METAGEVAFVAVGGAGRSATDYSRCSRAAAFTDHIGAKTFRARAAYVHRPVNESDLGRESDILLRRELTRHRVSLEDLVAYGWEVESDVLGSLHHGKRDGVVLSWLAEAVSGGSDPVAALDVGCSYGHHLFRLDSMLGKPQQVRFVGVDLYDRAISYARAFAGTLPGYANCSFQVADLSVGLPFEDNTFDAVNLADVLEHLERPIDALRELARVAKPSGSIVISTPLRDSAFKRLARASNRIAHGRLYTAYYKGKGADLDAAGEPVMETSAGLPHVSELSWRELRQAVAESGLAIRRAQFMSVLSGSRWFDEHKLMLSGLLALEALHDVLQRPSWAHSVLVELVMARKS